MAKFEVFPKEWTAAYAGHEIRVRNSWTGGLKLFVDGDCLATNNQMMALDKKKPLMRAEVAPESGEPFVVEVFAFALLSIKVKLVVNGNQLAGDSF